MSTTALAVCCVLSAGCGTILSISSGEGVAEAKDSSAGEREGGPITFYAGSECPHTWIARDPTPAQEILGLACGKVFGGGLAFDHAMEHRHIQYDDRKADPIAAALQLVECSVSAPRFRLGNGKSTCERDPAAVGIAALYLTAADEARLAPALAALEIPDGAKTVFSALVRDARASTQRLSAALDPRRTKMYLTVPAAVASKRAAYFQQHAAIYQQLDAAMRGPNEKPLVRRLETLRAEYLATCRTADCIIEPFVIDVTRELVRLHLTGKRDLLAVAEQQNLNTPGSARHTFGLEVGKALYETMAEEHKAHAAYGDAKRANMDPSTLASRFGANPPLDIDPTAVWVGAETLPDPTAALTSRDSPEFLDQGGIVKSVDRGATKKVGDETLVRVVFDPNVDTFDITSCYDTNKIVGVDFQGDHATVRYDSVCTTVGHRTEVTKIPPVWIPSDEARAIQHGENLSVITPRGSTDGVVVVSRARGRAKASGPTKVLQIRDARVGAR